MHKDLGVTYDRNTLADVRRRVGKSLQSATDTLKYLESRDGTEVPPAG